MLCLIVLKNNYNEVLYLEIELNLLYKIKHKIFISSLKVYFEVKEYLYFLSINSDILI